MKEYIQMRNADFAAKCRQYVMGSASRGCVATPRTVARAVMAGRAPSYYFNPDRMQAAVRRALKGREVGRQRYAASVPLDDVVRDVRRLRQQYPLVPLIQLLDLLAEGKAGEPRFYISERTALGLAREAVGELVG